MRRRAPRATWPLLALSVALLGAALPTSTALASNARVIVSGVSPIPASDVIVNTPITTSFDVSLTSAHPSALSSFLANLTNPASAQYRHFLTTAQFARQFGASSSAVSSLRNYLTTYGLSVGTLSKGRVVLHVRGTTTNIARAFSTSLTTVRRRDGVLAAQFTSPATLPASLASDVAGIAGLSTVVQPSTRTVMSHASAKLNVATTCPSDGGETTNAPNALGGYTPFQQAKLYGLDTAWAHGDTGVGQTIAVYELSSYDPGDLATYVNCFGLNPTITPVNVDGGPSGSFDNEPTLDIEEAVALAPGATIEVYQGPNNANGPIDVYQQIADDNTATIVSTSWGTCEGDPQGDPAAEQPIFEQMAAQGQTVVSAAGDAGSSDCNGITNNAPAVDDPASQPFVTGVGGLSVNSISPLNETVWNAGKGSSNVGAGGGGISALWSHPSWQVATGISSNEPYRLVPDLSVMGDPNTGFIEYFTGSKAGVCTQNCNAGWASIGGTSIGSPLVSALVAVAAQGCAVNRLGFINPSLYAMASTGFVDVTTGNNDLFGVGAYSAGPGYDMASGLGSPNGAPFLAGLCPAKFDLAKSSFAVSSQASTVTGPEIAISATLRDAKGLPLTNAVVSVSATSRGAGPYGRVEINRDGSSVTTSGNAAYNVTTDATGTSTFNVSTTSPGRVDIVVSYQSQVIYTNTIVFSASAVTTTVPSRPSIAKLTPLVGGFLLGVKAPSSNGGSAITLYQYSVSGGATWISFAKRSTSIRVSNLAKGKAYHVRVRALNSIGASVASPVKSVVTST